MSTENNKSIYENSLKILSDLISFQTISGEDNNSLINYSSINHPLVTCLRPILEW